MTCFICDELLIKHQAIERSAQSILVADSSKFDQVRPAAIAPLARFNVVVSNAEPPQAYLDFCEQSDIPLLI